MRWPLKPSSRKVSQQQFFNTDGFQHPDLPLSPNPQRSPRPQQNSSPGVNRSQTVSERFSSTYSGDRRSIAIEPGFDQSVPFSPDDFPQPSPPLTGGLARAQTVVRRDGARKHESEEPSPASLWTSHVAPLPPTREQAEVLPEDIYYEAPMSQYPPATPGKTSSDSGQAAALDRWSQRRLQRLNTEQGFREQRQGGGQGNLQSPPASFSEPAGYSNTSPAYPAQQQAPEPQPQQYHQQSQPHPSQQPAYQSARTAPSSHANAGLAIHTQAVSTASRSPNLSQEASQHQNIQHSPPDPGASYSSHDSTGRPQLSSSRSYSNTHQHQQSSAGSEEPSMSSSNNGSLPALRAQRSGNSNRQSMHNGLNSREGSALGGLQNGGQQGSGVPAFNASLVPAVGQASSQGPSQKAGDVGRVTPQPVQSSEDMTEEDVTQLIKDHKELREKYTKVKKYYFEKEDQVKQLQNSLAHQRLSQSRTSLDDSEYTTRFNRLDGLIAQLAFSIRKSWKSVPIWLMGSVNKDAVATGKQEMTAAGRAFISHWLVTEVFDRYFHPDLEANLSTQLKNIQTNIRRYAPQPQTAEEDEFLIAKIVNWRLSTLEGLTELFRSNTCAKNRAQLTDTLKTGLVSAVAAHLHEPAPSDLDGGVHMIIELVVSMAIHLPVESRDIQIEYYMPTWPINGEHMKLESGIPSLTLSAADDAAERLSMRSAHSDITDNTDGGATQHGGDKSSKSSRMLSAFTGTNRSGKEGGKEQQTRKQTGTTGSSSSLNRPDSSQGMKDNVPRVRMAAGIGVSVRGRSVLVKAPVFATN